MEDGKEPETKTQEPQPVEEGKEQHKKPTKKEKKAAKEAAGEGAGEEGKKGGKNEKELQKAERLRKRQEQEEEARKKREEKEKAKLAEDPMAGKYGNYELNRSQCNPDDRYKRKWSLVKEIDEKLVGQEVLIRGRVHHVRDTKTGAFLVIREQFSTIQAVVAEAQTSYGMKTFAHKISKESIVDVKATVVAPQNAIKGTT